MAKIPTKTRTRKPRPYRFTDTDRGRIKADLKRRLKPFLETLAANREGYEKSLDRGLPMLGPDWKLKDEGDDRHTVVFPLRVDVDLRAVKTAVKVLFPEEAAALRKSIVSYIERCKRDRRKVRRHADSHFRVENLVSHAWPFFGAGWIAGQALFNILTPDDESRDRWEGNLRGMAVEGFRVPPDTAARVVSELLDDEFKITMTPDALKKRFQELPRP